MIIEAFALGKTVVSTPTCGAIDLLSGGEYGYLTKRFDNPIEFAELMEKAVALPIDQKNRVDSLIKSFIIFKLLCFLTVCLKIEYGNYGA